VSLPQPVPGLVIRYAYRAGRGLQPGPDPLGLAGDASGMTGGGNRNLSDGAHAPSGLSWGFVTRKGR